MRRAFHQIWDRVRAVIGGSANLCEALVLQTLAFVLAVVVRCGARQLLVSAHTVLEPLHALLWSDDA